MLLGGCAPGGIPFPGTPGDNLTGNQGMTPSETYKPPEFSMSPTFSAPPELSEAEAKRLAKEHLATTLGISVGEISVVSVEKVNWPDTSLGLPQPDRVYAQVIVPGYKITLRASGKEYRYHAGWVVNKIVVIPAETRPGS